MNEKLEHAQLIEQWTKHRTHAPDDTAAFTRAVIDRIAADQAERSAPPQAVPRLPRLAIATACAAVGIGKFLIVLRLSI